MPKLTIIARVVDGLPLAASMEDDKYHRDLDVYKNQAKKIFKQLSSSSPGRLSIESGSEVFQCAPARIRLVPRGALAARTLLLAPERPRARRARARRGDTRPCARARARLGATRAHAHPYARLTIHPRRA